MWKRNLAPRNNINALLKTLGIVLAVVVGATGPAGAATDLHEAAKAVRMENYQHAFQLYSRAATNGNSEAQYQLANLYRLGKGVAKNPAKQRHWLQQAADARHPGAQYSLALLLQHSDATRASQLMQAAAQQGFAPAKTYLQRVGNSRLNTTNTQLSSVDRWFAAARKNQIDVLASLRSQVAAIDVLDEQQNSALAIAVQSGSLRAARWLLKQGANPAQRDRFGKGVGFVAIDAQQAAILDDLLSAGLDRKQTLPNGDTLLHYAVRRDYAVLLPQLLKKGIPVNARNSDGWTALDLARFADNKPLVTLLRQHGAKAGDSWLANGKHITAKSDNTNTMAQRWTGDTQPDVKQLAAIVSAGNTRLLRQLAADKPALVQQHLADGSSLLAIAIVNGQRGVVDTLLELGASPNDHVVGDYSALQWAARSGQAAIALALMKRGADLTETDKDKHDAVELALLNGHTTLAISMLQQNVRPQLPWGRYAYTAATVDAGEFVQHIAPKLKDLYRDSEQRSALWYAASHANDKLLAMLQHAGLHDDTPDSTGKTPVLIAVERACLPCVATLAPGADLNRTNPAGDTALIIASGNADEAMVRWLLGQDIDVNVRNALGDSALVAAVRANAIAVAKELVVAGASVTRKNKMGLSAQDIAEKLGPEMEAALASR